MIKTSQGKATMNKSQPRSPTEKMIEKKILSFL